MNGLQVRLLDKSIAQAMIVREHYLHRRTNIVYAFGIFGGDGPVGAVTFGIPASRHLQVGVCPSRPNVVMELNRLWVADSEPRNTESWFVSQALRALPPRIIVSYADSAANHTGYIYRALNFRFAGVTDMDRKTPRYDYLVPGKHTRDAFRGGAGTQCQRVRRRPKWRYWTVTGNRREQRDLTRIVKWPTLAWKGFVLPEWARS